MYYVYLVHIKNYGKGSKKAPQAKRCAGAGRKERLLVSEGDRNIL